ncbi:phage tail assembly chaperone family protein, TAC [Psychrobacter pygoscelis]|uniref:phage tail assembly chaperone family protein, TAC n=1 Tax=Psychrobacter pygoscelis TaxID=2488563 RepID=UPI0010408CE8|nr:phage tail assembly chaperone family protein, TAC [Psychrobacter pygoscelis]
MAKSTMLSKANILSAISTAMTPELLSIPELGGDVYIKPHTAGEREALETAFGEQRDKNGIRATVFVHSVCDAEGNLLFAEDDIEQVKQLPAKIVSKVFNKSNEINGISTDAVDKAGKNS